MTTYLPPLVYCNNPRHLKPVLCLPVGALESVFYACPSCATDYVAYTVNEPTSQQEDSAVSEQPDPANAMPAPDTAPVGPPPATDSPPSLALPTGTDTSPAPLLQPVGEPSQPAPTPPTASASPADSNAPSSDDTHEDAFGRKIKGGQAEHLHAWVTRSVVDDPNVGPITVTECVDCGARVVS